MDSEFVVFASGAFFGVCVYWLLFAFGKVVNRPSTLVVKERDNHGLPEYEDPISKQTRYDHYVAVEVSMKHGPTLKASLFAGRDNINSTDRHHWERKVVVVHGDRKFKRTKDWSFCDASSLIYRVLPNLEDETWTYSDDAGVRHTIRTEDIEKFSYTTSKEAVTNV